MTPVDYLDYWPSSIFTEILVRWLVTYVAQLNPLFGPQLKTGAIQLIQKNWG